MTDAAERALEQLYAVPPSAFIRERNARAVALTKAGQAAQARAVRRLRRPSATLWATNQLAHTDPGGVRAFVDAVTRARRTQLRDPRAAGEAGRQQRTHLDALLRQAKALLQQQGYRLTPAAERRISGTLLGAAVDTGRARELQRGRLTAELPAPGFEVLAGAESSGPLRLVRGGQPAARTDEDGRDADRRAQRAADDERRRRKAEELARVAGEQRAAAEQAERDVDELATRLAEARRHLRAAWRSAQTAAAAARKARNATPR
jgi:hypothetical protein